MSAFHHRDRQHQGQPRCPLPRRLGRLGHCLLLEHFLVLSVHTSRAPVSTRRAIFTLLISGTHKTALREATTPVEMLSAVRMEQLGSQESQTLNSMG